ncbi:unnamed protein product, partial [Mesorhabditis belari]|uniref:Transthyretin-like family protein n=1 Tax=Mesorhabditis belari TaxID=2138241 RepID=A0AAF3FM11_9BILA
MRLFIFSLLAATVTANMQTVTVRGTLICNRERWANAKITGGESEVSKIEPFIRVTHHCKARHGCSRASEYDVPREYIDNGVYDISYLSLDPTVHNEKEHCN